MAGRWGRVLSLSGPCRVRLPGLSKGGSCRLCSGSVSLQKTAAGLEATEEEIVLPRRKTWDKLSVLQALASTVNKDPTAARYIFQDDPFLAPTNNSSYQIFSLSKESGQNAAKYIIKSFPEFFQKDIAEPHIPCLMPEDHPPQLEEVSEAALKERIQLRKVKASVDMFDQLLQSGASLPLETTNSLLDLLCFYGDREPAGEDHREEKGQLEELEEAPEREKRQKASIHSGIKWRKNNNAERIFNLMPERNAHSYCTMIRGMVKHGAYQKAFDTCTDLVNNGHSANVDAFNALILAAPEIKDTASEKWELIEGLLKQMAEQKLQPNLFTFNAVLKSLRKCGGLARSVALQTLREMKALDIEPSLATFDHLLHIFYKSAVLSKAPENILLQVMNEIEGKSFSPLDPDDNNFFNRTMEICFDLKDLKLAYRLHGLLETGDNWKMIGNAVRQRYYYLRFFSLLCVMEQLDVVLKWYKDLCPSVFYPSWTEMLHLLEALDMANQLEMIPQIWKDIKWLGHAHRPRMTEEVLSLMARDTHPLETQMSFANCAAEIKSLYERREREWLTLEWTPSALGNIAILFSRAGWTQEAWEMLELFKKTNRIPRLHVMDRVLSSMQQSNRSDQAVKLVELAAAWALPFTSVLAARVMAEFTLSEEQKQAMESVEAVCSKEP
uniref:Small ribosomal subunit protein mS39 n=1 Tax=Sphenodon punctatus TaxID=8508 RepID=A0A8D0GK40_SPHPU